MSSPDPTSRARRPGPSVRTRVTEYEGAGQRTHEDRLATEEPLEIRVAGHGSPAQRVWVTMRTPGHDFELAAGFVANESIISPSDIRQVAYCTDADLDPEQEFNVVTITVAGATDIAHRHAALSAGSSACGVCGKDSVASVLDVRAADPWTGEIPSPDVVRSLPAALRERQPLFERTGGVHAAALADADGRLLVVREDVGRHNAVDKVIGARILAGEPRSAARLVVERSRGFRARPEGGDQRHRVLGVRRCTHQPLGSPGDRVGPGPLRLQQPFTLRPVRLNLPCCGVGS